jgi:Protein of unknown function (DUF664)
MRATSTVDRMATTGDLLLDGFDRVRDAVHGVLDGLTVESLCWRPVAGANPMGWLVWHLTRVQDDHVAAAAGVEQRWHADGWVERFGLPFGDDATGYGQDPAEVAKVAVGADLLAAYHDAVHAATAAYLRTLGDADLDRIVDRRWDPPVTLGVRLVSVLEDDLQHAGQAAYVRGLLGA